MRAIFNKKKEIKKRKWKKYKEVVKLFVVDPIHKEFSGTMSLSQINDEKTYLAKSEMGYNQKDTSLQKEIKLWMQKR